MESQPSIREEGAVGLDPLVSEAEVMGIYAQDESVEDNEEADPLAPPPEPAPEDEEAPSSEENPSKHTKFSCFGKESTCCDKDDRTVAKVMVPVTVSLTLFITLALVFGGAFESSGYTREDLYRDVIGISNSNGGLFFQDTWNAATKDANSPQAQAYQFIQEDAISTQILEEPQNVTRGDYHRVRQRFALASFFYSTGGHAWLEDTDWMDETKHECQWYTTYAKGNKAVCEPALDNALTYRAFALQDNNLSGSISHEFFDFLSLLREVDLSHNQLNNTLEDIIGPRGTPRLSMKRLALHNNKLTGTMDRFLKYFKSLEFLWLGRNSLTGTITPQIGALETLYKLDLGFNGLTGSIPSQLGLLTHSYLATAETELYLDHNQLSGSIPSGLGNLGGHLKHLWLHGNWLSSSIPLEVRRFISAETISFANNQLTSSIPTELLWSHVLKELDLSNNMLTGAIGTEIGFMRDLQTFRAANNSLSATIPTQIANCLELQYLDLSGNPKIAGSIPPSLCSISSLKVDCANLCGCHCKPCDTSAPTTAPSQADGTTAAPTVAPSVGPATNASQDELTASSLQLPLTGVWEDDDDDMALTNSTNSSSIETSNDTCYFVLAGQSNVLGFADLGHLEEIVQVEPYASRYQTLTGEWVELEKVFVTFDNEYGDLQRTQEGPLTPPGFGTNRRHFGPEVGFGFEMANLAMENGVCASIVIVKTAGVAALANDWNAPNGDFFEQMIEDVEDAMDRNDVITATLGSNSTSVLAGLVWFQGYADVFEPEFLAQYQDNLETWITEARKAFSQLPSTSSELPIVVAQMGGQGMETPSDAELEMRAIQANVVAAFDSDTIELTNTSQFIVGFNTSDETQVYDAGHHYWGRADVMIHIGEQMARDLWTIMA